MLPEKLQQSEPLNRIVWKKASELIANDYNPNVVIDSELRLLEFSILKQGWIQPILTTKNDVIIDGFHRHYLSKKSSALMDRYKGLVPCVELDLTESERMMLTIRINRAKGNHVAIKMHEIVSKLYQDHNCTKAEICQGIGATMEEVDLLLKENVFDALNIKEYNYSKAWVPLKK
jgi:ParB-like chromosome segregation protein Spo0J